jgi:hypothetical protein
LSLAWSAEQVTAGATAVAAAVALVAAIFAGWQVWELRRTRAEQARPFVVVDLQPSAVGSHVLNLVIENVGTTVAQDITFEFTPPLASTRPGYAIGDSALLTEGIPMLPPRRRLGFLFDRTPDRKKSRLPLRYDVVVNLADARGRRQKPQRYVIDISHLYGPSGQWVSTASTTSQSLSEASNPC